MINPKNHYLITVIVVVDSEGSHQWGQAGENRLLSSPHKILINDEGKMGIFGGETRWWRITSPVVKWLATSQCIASFLKDSCQECVALVRALRDIRQTHFIKWKSNTFPLKILKDREKLNHSKSEETEETWPLTAIYDLELYPGQERKRDMVGTSWQRVNGVCGGWNDIWKWPAWLYDVYIGECPCFGEIHTGVIRNDGAACQQLVLK